ncbi:hypothetical protein G4B88_011940 [Cannabis sativa]|uniref:3-methyl-2-oxobutanoate hydroxymethyltransferase n=1 Tax=Cannabis sativa TaxID=3483 RepID=A0A7J6HD10_CANSA|nr:hypothetical protein G4B88_011940 [Cannabis sativa]
MHIKQKCTALRTNTTSLSHTMAFLTARASHLTRSHRATSLFKRFMSNVPENTVYGGPAAQTSNDRVTLTHLRQKHKKGEPITVVTAYDYPSAVHLDMAGIDISLVGDSAAMVVHGYDTTLPISLDEMLVHCRAVARGAKRPLLVGDLPFGSYESSSSQAVDTAVRILKEGGMDAIKLEGASPSRINAAKSIVESGIAVMGHVGLTPQAISVLGGFKPQGRNVSSAVKIVETALTLQEAGCFAVVLECVPAPVAAAVTSALKIPTIGIGAGPFCSGQVNEAGKSSYLEHVKTSEISRALLTVKILSSMASTSNSAPRAAASTSATGITDLPAASQVLVYHDLLGMLQHPHHAKVTPKFCKQFACVGDVINKALLEYKKEVTQGCFPGPAYTPYKINSAYVGDFSNELQKLGLDKAASAAAEAAEDIKSPSEGSPKSE